MNMPHPLPEDTDPVDDLSTLSWVQDELRRSLEAAHKSLRRFLKESDARSGSDIDAVDPSVLRAARAQLHQGVGALEMVGLPGPARVLRASESAVQRLIARPKQINAAAVEGIESASFGVLDYLSRKLAGKGLPSLALFPQYRALQELAGADRVHPADLWRDDWQWRHLPADPSATPLAADASVRSAMETQVLALMRGPNRAAMGRMSDLCASLGAASGGNLAQLWRLSAAFFEAQSANLLQPDVYAKRISSRLLAQLRMGIAGQTEVSNRLAQDVLFFCAHARVPGDAQAAPRLRMVREVYELDGAAAFDYQTLRLGRFDPAWVVQARKRVASAKEVWSAVAGGESHRMPGLSEQFTLVGDSLRRLYPSGEALADALQDAVNQTLAKRETPPPALAMEVATSVLYLDASLEEGEFDHPLVATRMQRLAQRIRQVREGQDAQPLEPWMEELYRRVSERQTMGSVVQELRASLSEVEKQIDQYFRNPAQREVLIPVPSQLSAMRGVLSVLDMDQASQAVLRMRDDVDALASTEVDPQHMAHSATFTHLADNLGALSFMIDMLSVQPQMAKSLFSFDAEEGSLRAVMGRRTNLRSTFGGFDELGNQAPAPLVHQAQTLALAAGQPDLPDEALQQDLQRLSQQALLADQRALAETMVAAQTALQRATDDTQRQAARAELAQAVAELSAPVVDETPVQQPVRQTPAPQPEVQGSTGLEDDAEMREIFVDEAREVLQSAHEALQRLGDDPESLSELTLIRRVFHTLKGSARMVGLADFGEAAWACEQLYNARLAQSPRLEREVGVFTAEALNYLGPWVEAIASGRNEGHEPTALIAGALQLRHVAQAPLQVPPAQDIAAPLHEPHHAPASSTLMERVPNLPSAEDLDLSFDLSAPAEQPATPRHEASAASSEAAGAATTAQPFDDELLFELDLGQDPQAELRVYEAAEHGSDAAVGLPLLAPADNSAPSEAVLEPISLDLRPLAAEHAEFADTNLEFAPLPQLDVGADASWNEPASAVTEPAAARHAPPLQVDFADTSLEEALAPSATAEQAARTEAPQPVTLEWPAAQDAAETQSPDEARTLSRAAQSVEDEQVKIIGGLRIGIPLFNIYLNEADELSRRLCTELAEWALEPQRPVGENTAAYAHSLAGSSATVGYVELSALARSLEHALTRSHAKGRGGAGEPQLFNDAADEVRHLLHQFAAGFLKPVSAALLRRLEEHELELARPTPHSVAAEAPGGLQASGAEPAPDMADISAADEGSGFMPFEPAAPTGLGLVAVSTLSALPQAVLPLPQARADALDDEDDIDAVDSVDDELFPIFQEEGEELLPQLQSRMREWARRPSEMQAAGACMRTLHTFKGGARLAGAMRLGDMAHRLETAIEHLLARGHAGPADLERLLARVDAISSSFEQLGRPVVEAVATPAPASRAMPLQPLPALPPSAVLPPSQPAPVAATASAPSTAAPQALAAIDWSRFHAGAAPAQPLADKPVTSMPTVRVRAPLLDRLVNQAGEVSITRARIETDVAQIKGSLVDLTENLERLRRQLRELELQADSQIASRMEAAKASAQGFDPLEMDRFTRFQELTRMMAESVNDVATVQRGLQRSLQATEDELAAQARLTRDLQDDLLRTRMVEFEALADRLYRVVRQAAKETGKQVRLDLVGGAIEVDRGVLDRMTGPFEHLLRNSVAHGIESPQARLRAGKDATGSIIISVAQEGNEVHVEVRDDGAGLNLPRIRERALAQGLLAGDAPVADAELANMIFAPGFSTAERVSELSGRGVGMDVVRAEVNAMGGRIETATAAGLGASFRLVLPLTTAVTQVVMLRCGELNIAVPSTLVEVVRRVPADEIAQAYASGAYTVGERALPFFWLGALLQAGGRGSSQARAQPVVVIRSASQRVALHVDEVLGNQEVVVKNLGPQLSRLPGLAGVTLLASGAVALIYNPVALATLYGDTARARPRPAAKVDEPLLPVAAEVLAPLVLVVDDSLTVRRVTQRLLLREGYRVTLAKDGLDALDKLSGELPAVVLSDIEMPRMDGFDLVRNLRSDARLAGLPVVMITSRIAQKHRDYAAELGVEHYLGKPYSEDELLSLVGHYAQPATVG